MRMGQPRCGWFACRAFRGSCDPRLFTENHSVVQGSVGGDVGFAELAAALVRPAYKFSKTFRKRSAMREEENRARAWNLPMLLS